MTLKIVIPNFLEVKDKQKYTEYDIVNYFTELFHVLTVIGYTCYLE